jgi:hypothetical protein
MRALALGLFATVSLFVFGGTACNETPQPAQPTGPVAETVSPKESPMQYKVLADEVSTQANTVEYHVLVADQPKHDDVQKLLEFMYRHLMTRREPEPATLNGYVYSNEAQYKTPPRSPIASVSKKQGEMGPSFENKVPLEFWQQVDVALEPHTDKGWKLAKKIERDDNAKTLTITVPYTEPGVDQWAEKLSFNQAMVVFTDTAQALFEKVPELKAMKFVGRYKDQDVVTMNLDRTDYQALKIPDIEEQIGQLHGRAFLELSTGRGSDAKVAKDNANRMMAVYKKMLGQLKGKATVSPTLK